MNATVRLSKADMNKLMNKLAPIKVDGMIRRSLYKSSQFIAGWIKTKRLTGPRPKYLGVVTGRLRASITATPAIKTGSGYKTSIGTNVVYGRIHELGGKTGRGYGVKIPPRPFLRPAIEDKGNIRGVENDLKRSIDKLLRS